jgi:hypothetical protein
MPELITQSIPDAIVTNQEIPQQGQPTEPVPPTPPDQIQETQTEDNKEAKPRDRALARKWRKYNRQMEAYQRERQEFDQVQSLAKTNPVEFLKRYGKTLEDWATSEVETPETRAMSEVEKLKAEIQKEKEEAQKLKTETQYQRNQTIIQEAVAAKLIPETHRHISALISEGLLNKQEVTKDIASQLQESYLANSDLQEDLEDLAPNQQEELVAKWMDKEITKYYEKLESEYKSQLVALKAIIDKLAIAPSPTGMNNNSNGNNPQKPQTLTNAMSSTNVTSGETPKFKTEEEVVEWIKQKNGWQ